MHPTGIEPALKASEASVLSIRIRVHITGIALNITNLLQSMSYNSTSVVLCLVMEKSKLFLSLVKKFLGKQKTEISVQKFR